MITHKDLTDRLYNHFPGRLSTCGDLAEAILKRLELVEAQTGNMAAGLWVKEDNHRYKVFISWNKHPDKRIEYLWDRPNRRLKFIRVVKHAI